MRQSNIFVVSVLHFGAFIQLCVGAMLMPID